MHSRGAGVMRLVAARKRVIASLAAVAALVALLGAQSVGATTTSTSGPLTPSLARRLSQNVNQHVIVILKSQPAAAHVGSTAATSRAHAIVGVQAPLMRELRAVHATHIKSFQLVNAFAATVSKAEVARLKANRAVAQVIPDVEIKSGVPAQPSPGVSQAQVPPGDDANAQRDPGRVRPNGQVQLDPEGLSSTNTDSDNPHQRTARSLGITGAGVKVAWIADGIDPNNINFIRPDGNSAFGDYQDFTGDGPGQPPPATRRSSTQTRSPARASTSTTSTSFSAQPDPSACNIRIEGVAPGASLVGLERVRHVRGHHRVQLPPGDQLRGRGRSRQRDQRVVRLQPVPRRHRARRHQAVRRRRRRCGRRGQRVLGRRGQLQHDRLARHRSEADRVGGSTNFRFYAQTNYAAARYFATSGWLNDNISSLSSGGYSETGSTVDLIAPGD